MTLQELKDLWVWWMPDSENDATVLDDVSECIRVHTELAAREMFPEESVHPALHATATIGRYCAMKAAAVRERLAGQINAAIRHEQECDALYETLPEFAKW